MSFFSFFWYTLIDVYFKLYYPQAYKARVLVAARLGAFGTSISRRVRDNSFYDETGLAPLERRWHGGLADLLGTKHISREKASHIPCRLMLPMASQNLMPRSPLCPEKTVQNMRVGSGSSPRKDPETRRKGCRAEWASSAAS